MQARGLLPAFDLAPDAFCLIEDEGLRADSLRVIQDLRSDGCAVDYSLTPAKSDKQFKRAQEIKAAHVIKLERNGDGRLQVKVRNLRTREELALDPAELAPHLRTRSPA